MILLSAKYMISFSWKVKISNSWMSIIFNIDTMNKADLDNTENSIKEGT